MNTELLPRYDFGRRQDAINEHGDVVPVEVEEILEPSDNYYDELEAIHTIRTSEAHEGDGVSVSLVDRAVAIRGLARVYGRYARA